MMSEGYQGWSNQETWAMALHMANDQGLNEYSLGYAGAELENYPNDGDSENIEHLAETLRHWVEESIFSYENVKASRYVYAMLLDVGSLWKIDYREIAEHLIDRVKEGARV